MERHRLCYGANYSNCEDNLRCIKRKFSKIILLFLSPNKTRVSDLLFAAFSVKRNMSAPKKRPLRSFGFVSK
jgi:hypothetical protein